MVSLYHIHNLQFMEESKNKMFKKKEKLCLYTAIVLFVASQVLPNSVDNLDEMWNFNFARCITNGLIPYKEFNMINGPLLSLISAIFLKILGQEMIVTRILAIVLDSTILIMTYKIMDKLEVKDYLKYIILVILAGIMMPYFALDYNWATLLLVLIIIYLEMKKDSSWKREIIIGILAGLTITLKQTTGAIIVLAVLGWNLLTVRNYEDLKTYLKNMSLRLLGIITVVFVFIIILLKLGAINDYLDYCIFGIKTFSNRISYVNRLIKNTSIIIRILSIIPLPIYIILGYKYIKTSMKEFLILFTYSIAQMVVVYPISDEAHFVLAITPTAISIGYLLNSLVDIIKVPKKEEVFANTFLGGLLFLTAIVYFAFGINNYRLQNINYELQHFKYLPMEEKQIDEVKKMDEFIKAQEKPVYILDASAAIYMIPIDRYNKDYDMFNKGNLGSQGEDGQIEKLKNLENKIILIKNQKYNRNWQNPEKVREYIIDNMNKTGEVGVFDIYE